MVLASTDEGDFVVDPFAGSGTTLRVCQQLRRKCLGVELNQEYVSMIRDRLEKPFNGFDSIDPRMERVPRDLNDERLRDDYLKNHKEWFLRNHGISLKDFEAEVLRMYGKKNGNGQRNFEFWEEPSQSSDD
jgi:site-specific DNA-methyltransferase (adenine-specific)